MVESLAQVEEIFAPDPSVWLPDNLFLLQEYLPHDPEQGIVRLEFLGGELLYAMRVKTHGRFNLCPSPVCNPDDGDGVCEVPGRRSRAPPVEFFPYPEVPREAVDDRERIVRAARLDVGGIEYLETPTTGGACSTTSTRTRTCARRWRGVRLRSVRARGRLPAGANRTGTSARLVTSIPFQTTGENAHAQDLSSQPYCSPPPPW